MFDELIAKVKELEARLDAANTQRWATVTQATPLRIRFDGDAAALAVTPINFVGGLTVGDRVRAELNNGQLYVIDKVGGNIVPVGVVSPFAGSASPAGWLMANGAVYSPTDFPKLYAAIGTTYGGTAGAPLLPNLTRRVPVGLDAAGVAPNDQFNVLGKQGGSSTHQLTVAEMPTHSHTQDAHSHGPGNLTGGLRMRNSDDSGTALWGTLAYNFSAYDLYGNGSTGRTGTPSVEITGGATSSTTATNQNTGGNGAHNNLQPYLTMNYIIKAV